MSGFGEVDLGAPEMVWRKATWRGSFILISGADKSVVGIPFPFAARGGAKCDGCEGLDVCSSGGPEGMTELILDKDLEFL